MSGKSAQTEALTRNIEVNDLWNFFQAKTIRQTVLRTAAEALELELREGLAPAEKAKLEKRLSAWKANVARLESEPDKQEGRQELARRAKETEGKRDRSLSRFHMFEVGSAAFQLAIVLASASIVAAAVILLWASIGLGAIGIAFFAVGWMAPTLIHL